MSTQVNQQHEENFRRYIPYVLIVMIILLGNYNHIFGIDVYIHDDIVRYNSAIEQKDIHYLLKICSFEYLLRWINITPLVVRISVWELCKLSIWLGRLFFVSAFMIPLSASIYYFLHRYWKLPVYLSLLLAVLPACNPVQHEVPAYLDGSYPVTGSLVVMIALIFAAKFIENNRAIFWILAAFFYFIAQTLMQNAVFLLAPILCHFWFAKKDFRQFVIIGFPFVFFAGYNVIRSFLLPRGPATVTDLAPATMLQRYSDMFWLADPFSFLWGQFAMAHAVFLSAFLVFSLFFFIYRYKQSLSWKNIIDSLNHSRELQFYCFSLVWYIATAIVFVVISPYFPIYHTYLPSFGLVAACVYSLYAIFNSRVSKQKLIYISIGVIFLLVASRLYCTHVELKSINGTYNTIKSTVSQCAYPPSSQIAILGQFDYNLGRGVWPMSTGMVRVMTGRRDLSGIMPYEFHFYDPFTGDQGRNWSRPKMTGLVLEEPVFIYRYDPLRRELVQLAYGLQWFKESPDNAWNLYEFDKHTGSPKRRFEGKGMHEYRELLDSLNGQGIAPQDIAWGNPKKIQ